MDELHRRLAAAARAGDLVGVRAALEAGAKPSAYAEDAYSFLVGALTAAQPLAQRLAIADLMLEHDPDALRQGTNMLSAMPVLHIMALAGDAEVCTWVLDHRVDVHAPDGFNNTALHYAGMGHFSNEGGRADVCRVLLARGATPKLTNDDDQSPLDKLAAAAAPMSVGHADRHQAALVLLEAGGHPNDDGRQLAHWLSRAFCAPLATALVQRGYELALRTAAEASQDSSLARWLAARDARQAIESTLQDAAP